jgi:hypothetical protein
VSLRTAAWLALAGFIALGICLVLADIEEIRRTVLRVEHELSSWRFHTYVTRNWTRVFDPTFTIITLVIALLAMRLHPRRFGWR